MPGLSICSVLELFWNLFTYLSNVVIFSRGENPIFISEKLKKKLEMIQKLDSILDSCVCKASPGKDQIFEFFHPQKNWKFFKFTRHFSKTQSIFKFLTSCSNIDLSQSSKISSKLISFLRECSSFHHKFYRFCISVLISNKTGL